MKRNTLALICALAVCLSAGAGCGGDDEPADDGPLTKSEVVVAADALCSDIIDEIAALGPEPFYYAGLAAKWKAAAAVTEAYQPDFEAIEAEGSVGKTYASYVEARAQLTAVNERLGAIAAEVAKADFAGNQGAEDAATERYATATEQQAAVAEERDRFSQKLGLKVCGADVEPIVEETGAEPDVTFPEPENTLEEAAASFLAGAETANCAKLTAAEHSDNEPYTGPECGIYKDAFKGARIIGAEQYGPAGVVEIQTDGSPATIAFALDVGNVFRHVTDRTTSYGGLRPADPDNDAAEVASDYVVAVRENDFEALAETDIIDIDSSLIDSFRPQGKFDSLGPASSSGEQFVTDIRSDPEAAPVELGANQVMAYFLLEANGNTYVLTAVHNPGSTTSYGMAGFYPIPEGQ